MNDYDRKWKTMAFTWMKKTHYTAYSEGSSFVFLHWDKIQGDEKIRGEEPNSLKRNLPLKNIPRKFI